MDTITVDCRVRVIDSLTKYSPLVGLEGLVVDITDSPKRPVEVLLDNDDDATPFAFAELECVQAPVYAA